MIDVDSKYHGKSSEFTPGSKLLKMKYEKEIESLYNEGLFTGLHDSAGVAQDLWRGESFTNVKAKLEARKQTIINSQNTNTHSAVQPNSRSGVNTKTTSGKNHTDTHEKVQENSFKNFFDNRRLVGFDTETTGLDVKNENLSKRSRIWQTGLAIDGASGVEEHTSPFFTSNSDGSLSTAPRVSTVFAEDMMKNSNGRFSRKAAENGNFNTFLKLYDENKLATLDNSIINTLGSVNTSDVLVLQNMNFENSMLKSSLDQGILSPDVYQDIASRMHTVEMNEDGTVKTLLQRPASVQQFMRKADILYHTEYLNSFNEESFNQYRQNLNSAIDAYESLISSPNKTGTIAVELQDVTKAFLANAADRGLLDKRTSTLGLNVEFLSQAILGKGEQHTALQDSQDTLDLFKKIWSMNKEMQSGAELSETTLQTIENIKAKQPDEVNKRFFSTVRSVLDDFKTRKYTNLSGKYSWYNPQLNLQEKTSDGFVSETLEKISIGGRQSENRLNVAMENVLDRYSQYSDNIQGVNRKEYVNSLVEQFNNGADYNQLHTKVENDLFNFNPPETIGPQQRNLLNDTKTSLNEPSYLSEKTNFLGKEMSNKTKFGIIGGIGAGLAAMAFTSRPHPNHEQGHVSEQFYDEPYLGSAFIDFKERNKHYMM